MVRYRFSNFSERGQKGSFPLISQPEESAIFRELRNSWRIKQLQDYSYQTWFSKLEYAVRDRMSSRTLVWGNERELAFIFFSLLLYFGQWRDPKIRKTVILAYAG